MGMEARQAVGVLLCFTTLCSYINYKFIKLPKPIGITLVALIVTIIINIYSIFNLEVNDFARSLIDNLGFKDAFLHSMLGFLLFASSIHINAYELSKHKYSIALFSTISVLISTLLIGYATFFITKLIGVDLPFYYCFVFGALISPTDAITILSILKTTTLPKNLEMKITGEALFNDGMGIALFFMAIALAYGQEKSIDSSETILYFLREGGGGLALGITIGWITAKLLETIDDHELAIILTLAAVTCGNILATAILNVSGPICMAIAGIIVGSSLKNGILSKNCIRRVEEFWDLLDALLNAVLFVIIGLEFIGIDIHWSVSLAAVAIIIASLIIRWISVLIPELCLFKKTEFNHKAITVMTWGGLRGGISIALALSINGVYRDAILTITYFVVISSIILQGLTLKPLITKLKIKSNVLGAHWK